MTRLITRCPRGDLPTNLRIDLGSKERERGWPRLGSNQQPSACEAEAKSEPRRVFPLVIALLGVFLMTAGMGHV
jgi:hypothetical protein